MFRNLSTRGVALAAALLLVAPLAFAHEFKQGEITIVHPWARPTDKMAKTAAAYFMLKNAGNTPDKLLSVSADVADSVSLHHMVNKDGMMSMEPVDAITVPAHGMAALKPGGYHVMFVNLKAPFTEGEKFPLQLTFEKAGKVTVEVWVERPKDGGGAMDHGTSRGDMGGMKMGGDHDMGGMKH